MCVCDLYEEMGILWSNEWEEKPDCVNMTGAVHSTKPCLKVHESISYMLLHFMCKHSICFLTMKNISQMLSHWRRGLFDDYAKIRYGTFLTSSI